MSKTNPTTRADAPNYEVSDGIIYRYEPINISEAFGALSQVRDPLCGFRDADFQPWQQHRLDYVLPRAAEPFRVKGIGGSVKFRQCARITAEDPRKVPEGVPELPEPWLAYLGRGPIRFVCRSIGDQPAIWVRAQFEKLPWHDANGRGYAGSSEANHYAIDVRTAFAREHFPEYVEALGYPTEEAFPWCVGDKVKPIGSDTVGVVTVAAGDTSIVRFPDGSCAASSHAMLEDAADRIQLTDTQLLDKLAESELKLENGSQLWQVFTDRGDPQMTLREAIEAWGADE